VLLVYPFLHGLDRAAPALAAFLDQRWRHAWAGLDDEALLHVLDSTYFFLPYVREIVFPETAGFASDEPRAHLRQARDAARRPPGELLRSLRDDAVVRLRLADGALAELSRVTLRQARGGQPAFEAALRLLHVEATLFSGGVGFLVLKLSAEPPLTPAQLNDCLYHLRQVHAPKIGWALPVWRFAPPPEGAPATLECQARDLVDYLLQGLTRLPPPERPAPTLGEFQRAGAPAGSRWTASREGQVYGQYFRLFAYASLGGPDPGASAATAGEPVPWRRLGFESPQQLALYELATVSGVGAGDHQPHPARVRQLLADHLVALWAGWQALALRDSVVFLGLAPSRFNVEVLPANVERDYFPLYLLALYQKVRLSLLQGELIRRDARLLANAREARALWRAFVLFTNRFWFSEVTDRQQGSVLYRAFQRGLETAALYEEVSTETRDLEKYYGDREQEWTNSLLFAITFFGLPITIVVGLFGNFLLQHPPAEGGLLERLAGRPLRFGGLSGAEAVLFGGWLLGALALSLLVYGVWHLWKGRQPR
jgi:hypothetical protein